MKTFTYNNREFRVDSYSSNIEIYLISTEEEEGGRVLHIDCNWDSPCYRDDNYYEEDEMTSWYELGLYLDSDTIIPFLQWENPHLSYSECEELLLQYL